ncbi:YdeI/OmpD-associated family protein [Paenibacillus arenilitoris]|uniref:YdeI/OmpD-associated family protein n=1 Tax=Paenibacillus arenilitoris TaxID=2772299 RepID=A0A927H898_9BACL|nr:YdeI/OmpD-associated family protein [Paenibacillus arenilitoris]MBD2870409.1 YdeI/OmpD-associated family protein [Paenibacillus arenilitoris]
MNEALVKKLRLSPDMKALALGVPSGSYLEELGLTAEATAIDRAGQYDFVLLFVRSMAELEERAPAAVQAVKEDGLFWITYPKGTSKIKTDINRDTGWKHMLKLGMEGVAMISMDDTWSSMRYRPEGTAAGGGAKRRSASAALAGPSAPRTPGAQTEEAALPDDLAAALAASPAALEFFRGGLTAAKRRDFVKWITDAKREETRSARVTATVDKLERGLKSPFDK